MAIVLGKVLNENGSVGFRKTVCGYVLRNTHSLSDIVLCPVPVILQLELVTGKGPYHEQQVFAEVSKTRDVIL